MKISAKEIIDIILDVANKVLLIVYFCLSYVVIFSFLTFLVSISFLKSFKNEKLKLMHVLWGERNKLAVSVVWEYSYLMTFGLMLSLVSWTAALYLLGYYVEFFTIDSDSYFEWLLLVIGLLSLMSLYLYVTQKKSD